MKAFYKSKAFWALMLTVVAPAISTVSGIDVNNLLAYIKTLIETGNLSLVDFLNLAGQGIGVILAVLSLKDKERNPLIFKIKNNGEEK
jgi:hypothetical protein